MEKVDSVLIRELIDRLSPASDGYGWVLEGRITDRTRAALEAVCGASADSIEPAEAVALTPEPQHQPALKLAPVPVAPLCLDLLNAACPGSAPILCIDFGTAASKAAMHIRGMRVPEPLQLGEDEPWLSSTIAFDHEGRVLFGEAADLLARSDPSAVRIDSIKTRLWEDAASREGIVAEAGGCAFSVTDLVIAHLAFLQYRAGKVLEARGYDAYAPRRYSMPFADEPSKADVRASLGDWLGRAQIVADTLYPKHAAGVDAPVLRAVLDAVREIHTPEWFIRDDPACIGEPVAAGAFAVQADVADRQIYMVIDIGAGTTDFCLLCVKVTADGRIYAYRPENAQKSIPLAGDAVDAALLNHIADMHSLHGDTEAMAELRRNSRTWKESLFRDGVLDVTLADGFTAIYVGLEDFLASPGWKDFLHRLVEEQRERLAQADREWMNKWGIGAIRIVVTGGGAALPIRDALAAGRSGPGDRGPIREWRDALPESLVGEFEEPSIVPRLAVALGGSLPETPEEEDRTGMRGDSAVTPKHVLMPLDKAAAGI